MTSWRELPGSVWLLVGARAVNRLGAFTLPFLTVTLVAEQGASVAQAGYLMAAFGLATIPSRLAGGRLSDRWGPRATIVVGLCATAAAQLLVAGSRTLPQAAVAVVLLGLAFEVYEPPSQSLVADATAPEDRPIAFGLLFAALSAAGMGAGLLAALLAGFDLRWLFVADAVSCLLCAAVIARWLPVARPSSASVAGPARPWRDRRLLLLLGLGTLLATLYLQVTITLPLTVTGRGLPPSVIGLLLTASAVTVVIAQPLAAARALRRLDDPVAMAVAFVVLGIGLAGTGLATSIPAYVASTVVWSIGDLLLMGRAYTLVAAIAPEGGSGAYLAVYGTSWGFAAILAPVLGTQLLASTGPLVTWLLMAMASLGLAAAYLAARGPLGVPRGPDLGRD
ncbi:MFS transporter [Nocardioides islandensis]|uniref:MFS transporter n=1 Tax=Nocardioides islandensis TaxID=433663 RepID=UPI002B275316|nr:MFS transporter [Nocardioides islandensis]